MSQTKRDSLLEAIVNILFGYGVNFVANLFIFPLFGWDLSIKQNLTIGVFYTLISLARSFTLRRIFNKLKVFK